MTMRVRVIVIMTLTMLCQGVASAEEIVDHLIWKNVPITVVLPVGVERRIDFPVPVKIEWTDEVSNKTRSLQIRENGSVYWVADREFTRQRVNVYSMTGESWLLDVEARHGASHRTLVVIDDRFEDTDVSTEPSTNTSQRRYDAVDLVRFAAQNFYAPNRLVKPLPGVVRTPIDAEEVPLYRSGRVRTTPIAQWRAPGVPTMFVTAIRVQSISTTPVVLDPRNLRGQWLTATSQHNLVNPAGEVGDSTTWYLVSSRPFQESIR